MFWSNWWIWIQDSLYFLKQTSVLDPSHKTRFNLFTFICLWFHLFGSISKGITRDPVTGFGCVQCWDSPPCVRGFDVVTFKAVLWGFDAGLLMNEKILDCFGGGGAEMEKLPPARVLIREMSAWGEALGASPNSSSLICTLAQSRTRRDWVF